LGCQSLAKWDAQRWHPQPHRHDLRIFTNRLREKISVTFGNRVRVKVVEIFGPESSGKTTFVYPVTRRIKTP